MSHNDYQKMAGAFLNLWQEQLTRSMTDRDFVRNMMDMMQGMQQDSMQAFHTQKGNEQTQKHRHASAASGPRHGELDQLAQRLADCEQRIAELERALRRAQSSAPIKKGPASKPKAKSTKGVKTSKAKPAGSRSGTQKPASAAKRSSSGTSKTKNKKIIVKRAVKRKF